MDSIPVPATTSHAIELFLAIRAILDCTDETAALLVVASAMLEQQ